MAPQKILRGGGRGGGRGGLGVFDPSLEASKVTGSPEMAFLQMKMKKKQH